MKDPTSAEGCLEPALQTPCTGPWVSSRLFHSTLCKLEPLVSWGGEGRVLLPTVYGEGISHFAFICSWHSWGIDTLPSGYQRLKMLEFLSKMVCFHTTPHNLCVV